MCSHTVMCRRPPMISRFACMLADCTSTLLAMCGISASTTWAQLALYLAPTLVLILVHAAAVLLSESWATDCRDRCGAVFCTENGYESVQKHITDQAALCNPEDRIATGAKLDHNLCHNRERQNDARYQVVQQDEQQIVPDTRHHPSQHLN